MVTRREEEPDRRAWAPRLLAPLAFFTAATVLVLVIHNSLNAKTERSPESTTPTATTRAGGNAATGTTRRQSQRKRFYRVKTGDTLEGIALRFDTTVDDLLMLNPGIEATSLAPGQRIRVR